MKPSIVYRRWRIRSRPALKLLAVTRGLVHADSLLLFSIEKVGDPAFAVPGSGTSVARYRESEGRSVSKGRGSGTMAARFADSAAGSESIEGGSPSKALGSGTINAPSGVSG